MKFWGREPKKCQAVLTACSVDGRSSWPCELEDDGHEWHDRTTAPVSARWRERRFQTAGTVSVSLELDARATGWAAFGS